MTVGSYIYRPALLGTWAIHRKLLQIHRTTAYRLDFNPLWWRLDKIPDSSWRFWEARSTFVETCSRLSSESDTLFDLPWLDQVNSTKSTSGSDSRSVSHHRLPLHKRKNILIKSKAHNENKTSIGSTEAGQNRTVLCHIVDMATLSWVCHQTERLPKAMKSLCPKEWNECRALPRCHWSFQPLHCCNF